MPAHLASSLLVCACAVAAVAAIRGTWSPCGLSMISSINPMSEHARGHRYPLTAAWFITGATLGGLALGAVATALGPIVGLLPAAPTTAGLLAVGACLLSAADDVGVLPWRLPTHPRQVNERWLTGYRRWVYALGFGAQIGVGFATYIMTAAVYLTVVLAALATAVTGVAVVGLLVGAIFGLVRGSAVLLGARAADPGRLAALLERLDRAEPWSVRAAVGAALVAAFAVAVVMDGAIGAMIVAVLVVGGAVRTARRPADGGAEACATHRFAERATPTG